MHRHRFVHANFIGSANYNQTIIQPYCRVLWRCLSRISCLPRGEQPLHHVFRIPFFPLFNRVLKNKNQAVRQGARRYDKRSIFKHM